MPATVEVRQLVYEASHLRQQYTAVYLAPIKS